MAAAARQGGLAVAEVILARRVAAVGGNTDVPTLREALEVIERELDDEFGAPSAPRSERRRNPGRLLQVARLLVFGDLALQQVGGLLADGAAS